MRFYIIITFIPKAIFSEIIQNYTGTSKKKKVKKQVQKHSNNGNDIGELIGIDKSNAS